MAKRSKAQSRTLITQLIIVGLILAGVAIFLNSNLENRSKAEFNPTQQCLTACDSKFVKDPAACKLDCPGVIEQTTSCNDFCTENVINAVTKDKLECQKIYDFDRTNIRECTSRPGGKSTIGVCKTGCTGWINPCSASTGICRGTGSFTNTCTTACGNVKDEEKTCNEAFVASAFSGMNRLQLDSLIARCKQVFE